MLRPQLFFGALLVFFLAVFLSDSSRAIDVLTYRYNSTGDGANTSETNLTLDNVDLWDFGLKYTIPITGQIYAQPLIKTKVGTPPQDLAFVATQQNVVMAVNYAKGKTVWSNKLTNFGSPVSYVVVGTSDITPSIGICGTPLISGNYLYILSKATYTTNTTGLNPSIPDYTYTIYKIDIRNGNIVLFNNFADTASDGAHSTTFRTQIDPYVMGNGDGAIAVAGQTRVYFNALRQLNRTAISLVGGILYAGFGDHGNISPYHGWVLGFDPSTLKIVATFNTTPNGRKGGIWQAGGRIASDANNNLYLETGNGSFDAADSNGFTMTGFPKDADYGDCVLKLVRDSSSLSTMNPNGWGLKVVDYFTPSNNAYLFTNDLDMGSCAPILIPTGGKTFLIATSKDGSIFSLNAANLGKFSLTTNNILQTINNALAYPPVGYPNNDNGMYTPAALFTPAYFNGRLFYFGTGDNGKQFTLSTNGVIGGWSRDPGTGLVTTDAESTNSYIFPGMNSTISANGSSSMIVWGIDRGSSALHAFRATDLLEIWNSTQSLSDSFSGALKFTLPVVANGNVFVGADGALNIFGLAPASHN